MSISYWAWFGSLYLIFLFYQDIKNQMEIDERKNYFMMGITFSLLSHISRPFWYLLTLAILTILLNYFGNKMSGFGEGDIQAFSWIFTGLAILNPIWLLFYIITLSLFTSIYLLSKKYIYKINAPTPFFGIILLSYILTCGWFQIY